MKNGELSFIEQLPIDKITAKKLCRESGLNGKEIKDKIKRNILFKISKS